MPMPEIIASGIGFVVWRAGCFLPESVASAAWCRSVSRYRKEAMILG